MKASIGEVVEQITMTFYGETFIVYTPRQVAEMTGYSHTHICRMCDEGKLIGWKVFSRWWIPKSEVLGVRSD